jgi:hypothetical protein
MVWDKQAAVAANQLIAADANPGDGAISWVSTQDREGVAARLAPTVSDD